MSQVGGSDRIELDPGEIEEELARFTDSARLLASEEGRLLGEHPGHWVAAYGGEIRATGSSLRAVLARVAGLGIPAGHVALRRLERAPHPRVL